MQRSRIVFVSFCGCCVSVASAQKNDAITELLRPIVTGVAASPNVGGSAWETNRNGGYLVKKAMDVTGDGKPELFVASTLQSIKHEHTWHVFDVAENGTLSPYRTVLEHSFAWPTVENGHTQLFYVLPPDNERLRSSDERPYPVRVFKFNFPDIYETQAYVSEVEATKYRPSDLNQIPKLQAILLADYCANPDAKWAEVTEWKLDENGCLYCPADGERAMKNTHFTPQAALAMLGIPQQVPQNENFVAPPISSPAPLSKVAQPRPTKVRESKPAHPETSLKPIKAATWSVILILVVTLICLGWILLKKRS